jgi:hypothetical protein
MQGTLKDYLDGLRGCDDFARLQDKFNVRDNYFVLLYGDREDLFSKVTQAFKDSPQEDGLSNTWNLCWQDEDGTRQMFDYEPGTVQAQVYKGHCGMMVEEYKINGQTPAIALSFHPSQFSNLMKDVPPARAMALAIIDFGEYITREGLTVKFTKNELNLNYIPE